MSDDPWTWLAPVRARHLEAPLLGRYALEPLPADAYWELHERDFRAHYPPEAFLDLRRVLGTAARERAARVAASEAAGRLAEYWAARDADGRSRSSAGGPPATGAIRSSTSTCIRAPGGRAC